MPSLRMASCPPFFIANDWTIVIISCMRFISTKVKPVLLISCLSFPHNVDNLRKLLTIKEMKIFNTNQ